MAKKNLNLIFALVFLLLGFLEIFSTNYWYLGLLFFAMSFIWLILYSSRK